MDRRRGDISNLKAGENTPMLKEVAPIFSTIGNRARAHSNPFRWDARNDCELRNIPCYTCAGCDDCPFSYCNSRKYCGPRSNEYIAIYYDATVPCGTPRVSYIMVRRYQMNIVCNSDIVAYIYAATSI